MKKYRLVESCGTPHSKIKREELTTFIKEEIRGTLEASDEEVENQKDLNKELETTVDLHKQMDLDEAVNPELDNAITRLIGNLSRKWDLPKDEVYNTVLNRMKSQEFQASFWDRKGERTLNWEGNDLNEFNGGYGGSEFVYILLDKNNMKVLVKGVKNSEEANKKLDDKYGKGNDPMLYSIDGKKLEGFGGIEPRSNDNYEGEPDDIIENGLNEMAKISGDLKSSIEAVINANKDLESLPLKKAILADPNVKSALGDQKMYDTQLAKFIAAAKGERIINKRGPRVDPNKPKKAKKSSLRNEPKKKDKKSFTSKLGGRKYYTDKAGKEDGEGPTDNDLRKLAKSGGGKVGRDKIGLLQQQERSKLVKAFLSDMKGIGVVDNANRIIDKDKYSTEWAKAKDNIEAQVKSIR